MLKVLLIRPETSGKKLIPEPPKITFTFNSSARVTISFTCEAVFERFIKIEDRDIRRDYDNVTAEVLEQYFLGETEDEDSNIFTLKFMNEKLNSIKNLSKEVIDV